MAKGPADKGPVAKGPAGKAPGGKPAANSQPAIGEKGQVAAILVPADSSEMQVLEPRKAAARTEWTVAKDTSVVALVYGPRGLSMGKVKSLVDKHEEVLAQLADYAATTSQVESLVGALTSTQQSGGDVGAALTGFSKRYGVAVPKLDSKASSDQQVAVMLTALMPSVSTYDPLASRQAVMQQSAGLAASIAAVFFGSPVGLAAGGVSVLQNLRTMMFPDTEFRSAFSQSGSNGDGMAFCAKVQNSKTRTRVAYLWAHRIPNLGPPSVALDGEMHLPIGAKSAVKVKSAGPNGKPRDLQQARDWQLIPAAGGNPVPIGAGGGAGDTVELDLTRVRTAPGLYTLAASWDWSKLSIPGKVYLHPLGDLSKARLTPQSHDKLVEGNGTVPATFTGADFEFVEKAAVERVPKREANPVEVPFTLPGGKRAGLQDRIVVELSTAAQGSYRLLLAQGNGQTHEVPYTVQPPYPKLSPLPIYLNLGEESQPVRLEGTGLERVEGISTPAGTVTGRNVKLQAGLKVGMRFPIMLKVKGLEQLYTIPDALEITGARPRIAIVRKSLPDSLGITLRETEVPAGIEVGVALTVQNLPERADARPVVTVGCRGESIRRPLPLSGSGGLFFFTLDPGTVGAPGCRLNVIVSVSPEGTSEPHTIGRVVRVPVLEQFTLTDEQVAPDTYAGILKGKDLDTIEKVGWDDKTGLRVKSIPTPVPGEPQKQTLRIALPWPSPAPHAPVYLWLRGESTGRASVVKY